MSIYAGQRKSKYGAKKVTFDGIQFDSKAERDFYVLLQAKQQRGEVETFKVQPRYMLQESFVKNGKTFRATEYVADFEVTYADGRVEVIDVKGQETPVFQLKYKLFEARYPDLKLVRMRHVVKFGGWITTEEYNRLKRKEKAAESKLEAHARRVAKR